MEKRKEKRPNVDLLQSVLHNSEIGICAIDYLLPETTSENFEQTLNNQKAKLKKIADRAKQLAETYELEIKPNSFFKKSKMWFAVKTSSFFDDGTQHLADLMIFGHFMGVVNMIKSLADASKAKEDILQIARDLKTTEEECVNELVPYLERAKM